MVGLIVSGMPYCETDAVVALATRAGFLPLPGATLSGMGPEPFSAWLPRSERAASEGDHLATTLDEARDPHLDLELMVDGRPYALAAAEGMVHPTHLVEDPRLPFLLHDPELVALWSDPMLRIVLVHRAPWDVLESAARAGDGWAVAEPDGARSALRAHAEAMLALHARFGPRCLVIAHEALVLEPAGTLDRVRRFLGAEGASGRPPGPSGPVRSDDHPIARYFAWFEPELVDRLRSLDAVAAAPRPRRDPPPAPPFVASGSVSPALDLQVVLTLEEDAAWPEEALAALELATEAPVELTVVDAAPDDGSDDSADAAAEAPPARRAADVLEAHGVDVVRGDGRGSVAARRLGLERSRSQVVLHLGPEVRVTPALLAAVDAILDDGADVVHGPWRDLGGGDVVMPPAEVAVRTVFPHVLLADSALVRRSVLRAVDAWDVACGSWAASDLWLGAIAEGARFLRIEPLALEVLALGAGATDTDACFGASAADGEHGLRRLLDRREAVIRHELSDVDWSLAVIAAASDTEVRSLRLDVELLSDYARMCGVDAVAADARATRVERESLEALRESAARLEEVERALREERQDLERVRATRSWRWTGPLRRLERRLRVVRAGGAVG